MPVSPSRNLGPACRAKTPTTAEIIKAAYAALAPSSTANAAIPTRIENKLAYAAANTAVEIRFYHSNREPPLNQQWGGPYDIAPYPDEFQFNEIGWQDQITVTVKLQSRLAARSGPAAGPVRRRHRRAAGERNQRLQRRLHLSAYGLGHDRQRGRETGDSVCVPRPLRTDCKLKIAN